jgi:hypothetical protein
MKGIYPPVLILASILLFLSACQKDDIYVKKLKPEVVINQSGDRMLADTLLFDADTVYVIASSLYFDRGKVLKIEKGTLVKVKDMVSVNMEQGSQLIADGAESAPIVFTSFSRAGSQGVQSNDGSGKHFWYGIRLKGNPAAPNSSGGVVRFVRIEFAGGSENFSGKPAFYVENAGRNTVIENVQVSYSFETSSFGFSGGTVDARKLLSYASENYDYELSNGYKGSMQFVMAIRHPYFPLRIPGLGLHGILLNGSETFPVLSNVSVIGPSNNRETSLSYSQRPLSAAVFITGGARVKIRHSLFISIPRSSFFVNEGRSARALNLGPSEFTYSYAHCPDSSKTFFLPAGVYPPFNSVDFKQFMLEARFNNKEIINLDELKMQDLFNYSNAVPVPGAGSSLFTTTDFSGSFATAFFERVNFIGASGTDTWMKNWINMQPLWTNYNFAE